jgi:hypothetical protein
LVVLSKVDLASPATVTALAGRAADLTLGTQLVADAAPDWLGGSLDDRAYENLLCDDGAAKKTL